MFPLFAHRVELAEFQHDAVGRVALYDFVDKVWFAVRFVAALFRDYGRGIFFLNMKQPTSKCKESGHCQS